jgi:hypothetical protein
MDIKQEGYDDVGYSHMTYDRVRRMGIMNTTINLPVL